MSPCPTREDFARFLAEELSADQSAAVAEHLEACASCQAILEQLTGSLLGGSRATPWLSATANGDHTPPPEDLLRRLEGSLFLSTPAGLVSSATGSPAGRALLAQPAAEPDWPVIPNYEILGVLGRGGMGIVYQARQPGLNRLVALKMIRTDGHHGAGLVARFRAEAEAVARLQHPNIVQIYEVGEHHGRPFFSLEFVAGGRLADRLDGTPQAPRLAADLAEGLAWAIHAAHQRGIVHRDLKPANILLASGGRQPPVVGEKREGEWAARVTETGGSPPPLAGCTLKISDFGLAKFLDDDASVQTASGQILGTPSYMAPEQAGGQAQEVGPGSDVYALGAILYELLTGRPPFKGTTVYDTLEQVRSRQPLPPSRLQPQVPRDLETICLKCLQKEPRRRYETARALAEDLHRFLAGESILARPAPAWERLLLWARRRPTIAALTSLSTLLTLVGLGLVLWQWQRAEAAGQRAVDKADDEARARESAEDEKKRAEAARRDALILLATRDLERGLQMCAQGEIDRGLLWLARSLETAPADAEHLQWLVRANLAAWQRQLHSFHSLVAHASEVYAAALSPDGQTILTGTNAGTVHLWDARTGQPRGAPMRHGHQVTAVAFSPDGKVAATASWDKTARLWDTTTGTPVGEPLRHEQEVVCVAFQPDGQAVLTGSLDKTARLWSSATGKPLLPPLRHRGPVHAVAFSPDGRLIATAGGDATVQLWATITGQRIGEPLVHSAAVLAVAFQPHGQLLVTSSHDGTGRFWDVATGKLTGPPVTFRDRSPVSLICFSPDGRFVLAAGHANTVQLWEAATRQPYGPPLDHPQLVTTLAFSHDGRLLATGCFDGTTRLWHSATRRPFGQPLRHRLPVSAIAFGPEDCTILTASVDQTAQVWGVAPGKPPGQVLPSQGAASGLAFTPDGHSVWLTVADGNVERWGLADGKPVGPRVQPGSPVSRVFASPDGRTIVTADLDEARLWDVATARPIGGPWKHRAQLTVILYSPDSRLVLTGSLDGSARLWDTATGAAHGLVMRPLGTVHAAAFSPDGRTLVLGCSGVRASLWDVATGQPSGAPLLHDGAILAVAFHPSGKLVLTASRDRTACLWESTTGKQVGAPLTHEEAILCAGFSPDGTLAVTGGQDKVARLWDVATGKPHGEPLPHAATVEEAAFNPDGTLLLTASQDRTVYLWDVRTGKLLGPPLPRQNRNLALGFRRDGQTIPLGGLDAELILAQVPRPLSGDVEQIRLGLQVLTRTQLDTAGGTRMLDMAAWRQCRRELEGQGIPPGP